MKTSTKTGSSDRHRSLISRGAIGALLGALTAGVALAVGEIAAIFTGPASAPVYAVGAAAVNLTPAPVKEYAVAHFGEHDKQLLITTILAALTIVALLAGIAALRHFAVGALLVTLFASLGITSAVSQPTSRPSWAIPSALGGVAAIAALRLLVRLYQPSTLTPEPAGSAAPPTPPVSPRPPVSPTPPSSPRPPSSAPSTASTASTTPTPPTTSTAFAAQSAPDVTPSDASAPPAATIHGTTDRRRFILAASGLAVGSAAAGFGGNLITTRRYSVDAARAAVRIPRPAHPAPPLPAGVHPNVPGLSQFFTRNEDFYRVDTALVLPQVRPDSWTLRIHGMVDKPVELSFADLLRRPLHERDLTVSCVSDPVGGPYVGNARWIGADLPQLLKSAGVQRGSDQLLARSVDGMTIGTPLASVLDGRAALLAVAMNGEALPIPHGFPARMIVPGFYGYASACKWVTDLYVTTFAQQTAYWVQRGYARVGTMKTQSRIDVPKPFAQLKAGPVTIAGIAWATDRGISDVQVSVDQGPWLTAQLAAQDTPDTWRQWTYDWRADPGTHSLRVRAADNSGEYQTGIRADPYPSGASGWESIVVTVT